ncbi:MAG: 30S ribosomal protein S4 [Candidatus Pacebacteria bacterium]|nr:30S ribosomal protein S4 [Candidatus Paceibacterota bacterium]
MVLDLQRLVEFNLILITEIQNMIINAKCKKCRAYGQKLFLKGDKCYSEHCVLNKRPYPPGGTKQKRQYKRSMSNYQKQLFEKQKVKLFYGINESQLENIFNKAKNLVGSTPENLAKILEKRMDNVLFNAGFGKSKKYTRQLINHGHFVLNNRRHTIPSTTLKVGDTISIRKESENIKAFNNIKEDILKRKSPNHIKIDSEKLTVTLEKEPVISEINLPFDFDTIVEFYSR